MNIAQEGNNIFVFKRARSANSMRIKVDAGVAVVQVNNSHRSFARDAERIGMSKRDVK